MDFTYYEYLRATNPFMRMLDGKEAATSEVDDILRWTESNCNHDKIAEFVKRENFIPTQPILANTK